MRHQQSKGGIVGRIVQAGLALVLFAIGVILVFIPGPAILFFALSGAMVASESRLAARGLDWTELKLRVLFAWGTRHWKKLHALGKTVVVSIATLGAAAMAYASYRVLSG